MTVLIPIANLRERADNANAMPRDLFRKLVANIRRTGRYPTIIVRPIEEDVGEHDRYEILDGHHRVCALRELEITEARCDVWDDVDDDEALVLLTTLNRLSGHDDPALRAHLVKQLAERFGRERVATMLPETLPQLDRLIEFEAHPPAPIDRDDITPLPEAVTFFLTTTQRANLDQRLREARADGTRSQKLIALLELDLDHTPNHESPNE